MRNKVNPHEELPTLLEFLASGYSYEAPKFPSDFATSHSKDNTSNVKGKSQNS